MIVDDESAVLVVENATKVYPGGVQALRHVSLTVHAGESVAVVGPSGSGKSTLLQLMGTLDTPTSGRVLIRGHDVATLPDRRLAAVRARWVGFVFQQFFLTPHLSAVDNVATGLLYHGVPPRQRRRLARAALERVGLGHRLDHRPNHLSGGEKQRVAIARAFAARPRLVVCDEITAPLDVSVQASIVELLLELRRAHGTAYLFITHDLNLVRQIAHRLAVMQAGELVDLLEPGQLAGAAPYTRELIAATPIPVG
jgi:putative ABC transport system ATP-binding protein